MSRNDDHDPRKARAELRRARMTVEVVPLGLPKAPPYANSSPEERLEAALRLMDHHYALCQRAPRLPRSAWPGETFKCGDESG